jgi:hypothetical protein
MPKIVNVTLDATRLAKLAAGDTLVFRIENADIGEIRVSLEGKPKKDHFAMIDDIFEGIFEKVLRQLK